MEGPRRELGNVEEAWNGTVPNIRQVSVGKTKTMEPFGSNKEWFQELTRKPKLIVPAPPGKDLRKEACYLHKGCSGKLSGEISAPATDLLLLENSREKNR
jgi:hypothetical protein